MRHSAAPSDVSKRPWYRVLYLPVLVAVVAGIAIVFVFPEFGISLNRSMP